MSSKKFSPIIYTIFIAVALSGCITINLPGAVQEPAADTPLAAAATATPLPATPVIELPEATATSEASGLTDEVIRNSTYLSPILQAPIKLENGVYDGVVDGVELHAVLQPGFAYGDLNGDGIDDAAFILAENTGGSGVFVSLVVVFSRDGSYQYTPGYTIDDRPVINSLLIQDGLVKISALVHGPNDPAVNPTNAIQAEYTLLAGQIFMTRLSSAFAGGVEHIINIESPLDGDVINDSFQLKGAMPVGPFENNLLLTIIDPLAGELVHEGFMVEAADMGAPATFDNLMGLPNVPTGTQVLLVLSELSMADGTAMALDSVLLTVGE